MPSGNLAHTLSLSFGDMNMTLSVVAFGSSVPFVPDAVAAAVVVVVVELRGSEAVVRAGDDVTTLTLTSH